MGSRGGDAARHPTCSRKAVHTIMKLVIVSYLKDALQPYISSRTVKVYSEWAKEKEKNGHEATKAKTGEGLEAMGSSNGSTLKMIQIIDIQIGHESMVTTRSDHVFQNTSALEIFQGKYL